MSSSDIAIPLELPVGFLLSKLGQRHPVRGVVALEQLQTTVAVLADGTCEVDLEIEALNGGEVMAYGAVKTIWAGECRRCLQPMREAVEVRIKELFERRPKEGETYLLQDDKLYLEPMLREALLLALPLAPLCSADCAGPVPENFKVALTEAESGDGTGIGTDADSDENTSTEPPKDPRWQALDALKFDDSASSASS